MAAPPFSPDDAQRCVLEHQTGALLVTGGAGTGMTAVLRERFAALLEGGADPERTVLVVGGTRARDDAKAVLLARLRESLPGLQVVTVHGLANRVLKERHAALGYAEPPAVWSATEQFAKVRELLGDQDPTDWPAYGHLLGMRGFADQVRQFLLRAQEELRSPEAIREAAVRRGLTGWPELARFLAEYQAVLDDLNAVDFAALLQRAAAALQAEPGEPLVDHLLVDDYQDTTLAAEALVKALRATEIVVAGNPDAHIFSFQGTTSVPLARFAEAFPDASTVELVTQHRAPEPVATDAWVALHTSEEHAAVARELRRIHVEDGVPWADLAVVVRRQGPHVAGLLRALDDARVPRAVPERGLSLTGEPATLPYVLALRWLVADEVRREELVEQLLTSARGGGGGGRAGPGGLRPPPHHTHRSVARALDVTEGLAPAEAQAVEAANAVLTKASLFAGMDVQDTFKVLWDELACSRRIVQEAGADLDTVVTFANAVSDASEEADAGVPAFLEALDAGDRGPGYAAWERSKPEAVRVITAHGAAGQEFDTVIVAGALEGNFPSLSRPEPMFDLAVLDRAMGRSERVRDRLEDERRLFHVILGRARRRVLLVCADAHPDAHEMSARTRFADETPGVAWKSAPGGPFDEPVSVREAAAAWRRRLADPGAPTWRRLAALDGLVALGVDPSRWWFQRDWTDPGTPLHDELRVSYSRLSNLEACELYHVLGDELGLGKPAGYHAWVGKTVHKVIEEVEEGSIPKDPKAIVRALDERWRPQEFPSLAVSTAFHKLAREHMLRNWFETYGEHPALAIEQRFDFEFEGATITGYIDRIGAHLAKDGFVITDFKTGKADKAGPPADNLQLGIYYLAVQESEDLGAFRPVREVELAFLRGDWRDTRIQFRKWPVNDRDEAWQKDMRERLAQLVARERELQERETYRPNPYANCRFCDFRTLCPLWAEGQPIFPAESLRREVPA